MLKLAFILLFMFTVTTVNAENPLFIPDSPSYVVATWQVDTADVPVTERINELLNEAKYPGNSENYAQAASLLSSLRAQTREDPQLIPQLIYYDAIISQHFHGFAKSKQLLSQLLALRPQHANGLLLKANMQLVLGEVNAAIQTCSSLLGIAPTLVVAVCSLNAKSQQDKLEEIYQQLNQFLKMQTAHRGLSSNNETKQTLPAELPSAFAEIDVWVAEIQASLAKDLGKLLEAQAILRPYTQHKVPLSYWVLWSDIQLALDKPENVLIKVGRLVEQTSNQDDALLLKLAIAEKQMRLPQDLWNSILVKRIALREQRNDTEHAFDIALYYLHIKEDPLKAYKWAQINWQQAKLREDAHLLKITKKAVEQSHLLPSEPEILTKNKGY